MVGRKVRKLLDEWNVRPELSCAYRPQGNAVVERVHRSAKRSAARARRGVEEAVFWLNSTRGNSRASPYELLFSARSKKPGVSEHREEIERPPLVKRSNDNNYQDCNRNPFAVGNRVYMRTPDGRCDAEWTGPHRVTSVLSGVSVELNADGIARHVSHLRAVPSDPDGEASLAPDGCEGSQQWGPLDSDSTDASESAGSESEAEDLDARVGHEGRINRSSRNRSRPSWWNDYDVRIA